MGVWVCVCVCCLLKKGKSLIAGAMSCICIQGRGALQIYWINELILSFEEVFNLQTHWNGALAASGQEERRREGKAQVCAEECGL